MAERARDSLAHCQQTKRSSSFHPTTYSSVAARSPCITLHCSALYCNIMTQNTLARGRKFSAIKPRNAALACHLKPYLTNFHALSRTNFMQPKFQFRPSFTQHTCESRQDPFFLRRSFATPTRPDIAYTSDRHTASTHSFMHIKDVWVYKHHRDCNQVSSWVEYIRALGDGANFISFIPGHLNPQHA
jgi:hypothetical protein